MEEDFWQRKELSTVNSNMSQPFPKPRDLRELGRCNNLQVVTLKSHFINTYILSRVSLKVGPLHSRVQAIAQLVLGRNSFGLSWLAVILSQLRSSHLRSRSEWEGGSEERSGGRSSQFNPVGSLHWKDGFKKAMFSS